MLTKTIGQLSAATVINDVDLLEIEQAGVSKYGTVSLLEANLITANIATTAESVLGTSNSALMTPLQVREAFSANNDAPVYACRAWVYFDGATTASSISGTYTRTVGTTQTVCVATAHGFITGNVAYVDFTSGGASDNTYIITVVDSNTFTVNTVSTSSVLTSNFTLPRAQIFGSGNVGNVSKIPASVASYLINFSTKMPSAYYATPGMAEATGSGSFIWRTDAFTATEYVVKIATTSQAGNAYETKCSVAVFA
jgi:hypothetical protein